MKMFATVLLAVCMAAGAAQARTMAHKYMTAPCAEGAAVKASCLCKSASGAHAMCHKGQWCHSFMAMCTK
jgi:hypothetical protein